MKPFHVLYTCYQLFRKYIALLLVCYQNQKTFKPMNKIFIYREHIIV